MCRCNKLALASTLIAGCMSASLLQEPKPMPPGRLRGALGLEAGAGFGSASLVPSARVRVGIAPRTELRAKLSSGWSTEVGVNVQVVDAKVDLMVMPSFLYADADDFFDEYGDSTEVESFGLPVVMDVPLSPNEQHSFYVGPDLRAGRAEGVDGFAALGLHFGFALSGPKGTGSFLPECAWFVMLTDRSEHGDDTVGNGLFNCSLGVSFGESRKVD